jgi:hypothetical protein
MRWTLFFLALVASLAAAACDGDDESTPPTPTPTETPAATGTGIEAVDRVLLTVETADPVAFEGLLRAQSIPCTNEFGGGGPPKCFNAPGMPPEGTPVEVFPHDTCEREWQFDLSAFTERILPRIEELYAVVRIDPMTPPEELAHGAYGIVYPDATGFETAHALIVTNEGIVAVDTNCGGTAEIFLRERASVQLARSNPRRPCVRIAQSRNGSMYSAASATHTPIAAQVLANASGNPTA